MAEKTQANNNSPVFLITGCSTGFGREIAIAALASDFRVIATARRAETVSDLEKRGAKTLAIAIYGQVDYLVNNAGYAQGGAIEEVTPGEALAQFNTNFFGLVNTTNAFLPHLRSRRAGTLVNISSEVTCTGLPGAGIYAASKAAITAVSDTWANELKEYGIRSICVLPGQFRTQFLKNAGVFGRPSTMVDGYEVLHGAMRHMANGDFSTAIRGDPTKAARNIVTVVTRAEVPLHFVVGEDSFVSFKAFYEKRLEEMKALHDLSTGTNFDEAAL
ncbi:Short-chain dehydrogenase reductase sdr [Mycena venus]|uniref:Short-chain dehydrogenase reductase sdr n=1 Tax=Mycena venus TaxID=2733690 RepID=A0A8H6Y9G0_9AGAR|nr:Short-chain dehydrogenase reductase sdr [Mycena venus]